MKRELTDQENDSVAGGFYINCDSQQEEKLNSGVCPYCGAMLVAGETTRDYIIVKKCSNSGCGKSFRLKPDGHWWLDDQTKRSGC